LGKTVDYDKTQATIYIYKPLKKAVKLGLLHEDKKSLSKEVEKLLAETYLGAESVEDLVKSE
jgi:hypothetical protein